MNTLIGEAVTCIYYPEYGQGYIKEIKRDSIVTVEFLLQYQMDFDSFELRPVDMDYDEYIKLVDEYFIKLTESKVGEDFE